MKYLSALAFVFSLNALSAPNSIIAIVGDKIITYDSIAKQINKNTTKKEKLALINQQIDRLLQQEKIQELGIKPKPKIVNAMLLNIAKQNGLTLEQLRANNQFDEILKRVSEELAFRGLQELVLQQVNITITPAEIEAALALNPVSSSNLVKQIKLAQIVLDVANEEPETKAYITKINEQIKNGASFLELAKKYSKNPIIETIWLAENKLPKLLQKQLLNLAVDEISKPFKTEKDWRIIKISNKREIDMHLLNIKTKLLQMKRYTFFQAWTKALRKKNLYIDIFEHKL